MLRRSQKYDGANPLKKMKGNSKIFKFIIGQEVNAEKSGPGLRDNVFLVSIKRQASAFWTTCKQHR